MSSTACGLCGPVHGHHITRRPGRHEPYFDPDLRLWLCSRPSLDRHARAHELLRAIGLDLLPPGADPLAYRLQLLEVHARWAGTTVPPSPWPMLPPATPWRSWSPRRGPP